MREMLPPYSGDHGQNYCRTLGQGSNDLEANDWLVVNQFTVFEGQHNRRPDIVIFVNGLPLGAIELKNAADEDADIWAAFHQFQTYQQQIPSLFVRVQGQGNRLRALPACP
jgi:type I site-specific restriction-modification system R (restriction) subunit